MGEPIIDVNVTDIYEDEDEIIIISISESALYGEFNATVLNKTTTYYFDLDAHEIIKLSNLTPGKYDVVIQCAECSFINAANATYTFEVFAKTTPELNVSASDIFVGEDAVVNVVMDDTFSGDVIVNVNNNNYTVFMNFGRLVRTIKELKLKQKMMNWFYQQQT